jgi:hypothetical protein
MTATTFSLDALAENPARAAGLTYEIRQALIQRCAALCLALADLSSAAPQASERVLGADEAAARMGKSVHWMRRQGRQLPFARRVGKSWRFVESGLVAYLQRKKWSG